MRDTMQGGDIDTHFNEKTLVELRPCSFSLPAAELNLVDRRHSQDTCTPPALSRFIRMSYLRP